jgi:hypothetical protein
MNNRKTTRAAMMGRKIIPIIIPAVIFVTYFFSGLSIYRDYGISWDEDIERFSGLVSAKTLLQTIDRELPEKVLGREISESIPNVSQYGDKYYGVVLQFPQLLLDRFSGNTQSMWETRHLFLFVFYFISVVALFLALQKIFGNWLVSLIGTLLLILTPRFFAESFYNIKDIGFFSAFSIAFYFLVRLFEKPSVFSAFTLGIAIAFASAVRIVGMALLPFAIGFLLASSMKKTITWKKFGVEMLVLLAFFSGFLFLFYPASWSSPLVFFYGVIEKMSHYPWDGNVYFMGKIYTAQALPRYYLPLWILVTTPIIVLLLSLLGIFYPLSRNKEAKRRSKNSLQMACWITSLSLLFGFISYGVIASPTMYDGWRQFYFLYLPVLVLAVFGAQVLLNLISNFINGRTLGSVLLLGLVAIGMVPSLIFIVDSHPYQNVYFNEIFGKKAFTLFEKDYWCLSYSGALHKLAQDDKGTIIPVLNDGPMEQAYAMLTDKEKGKIMLVRSKDDAKYYFNNFRAVPYRPEIGDEYFSIKVMGQKILSVEKNAKVSNSRTLQMEQENEKMKNITLDKVDDLFN